MRSWMDCMKTIINGILFRIANLAKEIDEKIAEGLKVSKADWNQNDKNSPGHVLNRPMYSYQENIGTRYEISDLSASPLPLVFGEEWYVMGDYAGYYDTYLPGGEKVTLTVGKNSSGELCIASDGNFAFETGTESGSGNRFIIYADRIYINASWNSMMKPTLSYTRRLAEPYYETAYKTIDTHLLPMADGETAGIVHPSGGRAVGTPVTVDENGKLYCDTEMDVVSIGSYEIDHGVTIDFKNKRSKVFLMDYHYSGSSRGSIEINGTYFDVYVNGTAKNIPATSLRCIYLAYADGQTKRLNLIKNSIT